jgi:hypothetical protein
MDLNREQIARIAHETNRAYCESIGDLSQLPWDAAPEWQQQSALSGVTFHLENLAAGVEPSPSASHDAWLKDKAEAGWTYGLVKDVERKRHPCFVPYDQLPAEQRMKDYLFAAICGAFFRCHSIATMSSSG